MTGKKDAITPPSDVDGLCLPNCQYGGRHAKKFMIRCCICMTWMHGDCLNLPTEELQGIWTCHNCREIPSALKSVQETCDAILRELKTLKSAVETKDELIAVLRSEISVKDEKITQLEDKIQDDETRDGNGGSGWGSGWGSERSDTRNPGRAPTYSEITRRPAVVPQTRPRSSDAQPNPPGFGVNTGFRPAARPAPAQRERPIMGTASDDDLFGADELRSVSRPTNETTGVFLTRVSPDTSEQVIQNFILRNTGMGPTVTKLKTRYDWYSSFHIRCDSPTAEKLLRPEVWPSGMLVKPFREKRRNGPE